MKKVEEVYESSIVSRVAEVFQVPEQRRASLLITDDLSGIGDLAQGNVLVKDYIVTSEINVVPFALGFMYVMEGSKLGGKVIYKHIHRTLGYSESYGAKFISDYGTDTFGLWKKFLSGLSMFVKQHDCEAEVIRGARYAFSSIYDFFESNRLIYEH